MRKRRDATGTVLRVVVLRVVVLMLAILPRPGAAAETRYAVPVGDSPSIGTPRAPVIIVEFLDYQ